MQRLNSSSSSPNCWCDSPSGLKSAYRDGKNGRVDEFSMTHLKSYQTKVLPSLVVTIAYKFQHLFLLFFFATAQRIAELGVL